ncbi:30S ribosomal protein S12 methylthiotransferase RimO [Candidatus Omnitrophota bacterium]
MKKTFSIISLGCPRNLVDSECIVSEFKKKGYMFQDDAPGSDTVIINTCAFIESAKTESIDTILKAIDAKKEGSVKRIIVSGCLSKRYKRELKREFKEIDEFRGVLDFSNTFKRDSMDSLTPRHYAYIKISEGCRNSCTYCVIPRLKGPYKTRSIESIIKEAKTLHERGLKEIILVGQDTSLYGVDLYGSKKLSELLKGLDKIFSGGWIKILYAHPLNLDRDTINAISESKNICRYIDLPLEHISDRILKRMGRKTKKKDLISLIEYIRKTIPNAAIRTSFIVGFPGEKESDFKELLAFIKDARFERLGLFRYSKEEGTAAYKFKDHISEKEKENRFNEVMSLQENLSRDINEKFKGRTLKVLIDEKEEDHYIGRTEYDAPEVDGSVYVKGRDLKEGCFYNVRIIDTYEYDLVGDVQGSKDQSNNSGARNYESRK